MSREILGLIFTPDNLRYMTRGLMLTLRILVGTVIFGLLLGLVFALLKCYGNKPLKMIATIYIDVFRNTPLILWILSFRFLLPKEIFFNGITPFSLFTGAIMAEIIRGGLNTIDNGQFEAAYSQGFSFFETLQRIVLPQVFKNIIPTVLSQVISVIKDSSFMWIVATEEFTGSCMTIMGRLTSTTEVFTMFGCMAGVYFVINFALSLLVRYLSRDKSNKREKKELAAA